ncbi:MAG: TonB-dependent receptor, partial [Bacteroidota bacterium]
MKKVLFLFFLLCSYLAKAQDATIKGFVKDSEKGEGLAMILVGLEGTDVGINTDEKGYYSLTKLKPGKYILIARNINYNEFKEEVELKAGQLITKNIILTKKDFQLGQVEVTGDKEQQINNVNISVETLRSKDFKIVPSFGGQKDIVQVLTTLPGFVSTGDQGGQVFVRGGSPIQNKVLLDGMIVYNPFHSIGLFSVFDTDIISGADIYTGGFGAQFGGRISSVMDIRTRDGNKKSLDGRIGFNPFGSKVQIEGPLKKMGKSGNGISYILSAKNSYLDRSSKIAYPYVNNGDGLPFNYRDLYGKLSFSGSNGSSFNVFGFSFDDAVTKYQALSNLKWKNIGFGSNFVVAPSSSPV